MTKRILVAYATGSGSTTDVANAIAEELAADGALVDVRLARDVQDIDAYSGIVLGSSIRIGRWLPDAVSFLETFKEEMAQVPVAYFTTCLTMVTNTEESRRTVLAYMEPVRQLAPDVTPVGLGLFAGSLNPGMQQIMPGASGPYGDFRNWEAIRAWTAEIRPALLAGEVKLAAPIVLSGAILSYTDMSGLDLQHVDLQQAQLVEARLRRTDLVGADLRGSDLTGADLQQADLRDAGLSWADMPDSDLRGARLQGANLIGVNMQHANLRGADLTGAILNGANLNRADLSGANLSKADLTWADLSHANLAGANLHSANLTWTDLSHAALADATLQQAVYNAYTRWPDGVDAEQMGCIWVERPQ